MNRKNSILRIVCLSLVALLLLGCSAPLPLSVSGKANSADDPLRPVSGRKIVLCLVNEISEEADKPFANASCVLNSKFKTTTDSEGRFEFRGLPNGSYMILYDDASEDFEKGLQDWDGKTIKVWDEEWLAQFATDEGDISVTIPPQYRPALINIPRLKIESIVVNGLVSLAERKGLVVGGAYFTADGKLVPSITLYPTVYVGGFKGFPFLIASEIEVDLKGWTLRPVTVEVKTDGVAKAEITVLVGAKDLLMPVPK